MGEFCERNEIRLESLANCERSPFRKEPFGKLLHGGGTHLLAESLLHKDMGEKVSNLFADHPSTQFCFLLGAFFATDWQVQSMSTAHVCSRYPFQCPLKSN